MEQTHANPRITWFWPRAGSKGTQPDFQIFKSTNCCYVFFAEGWMNMAGKWAFQFASWVWFRKENRKTNFFLKPKILIIQQKQPKALGISRYPMIHHACDCMYDTHTHTWGCGKHVADTKQPMKQMCFNYIVVQTLFMGLLFHVCFEVNPRNIFGNCDGHGIFGVRCWSDQNNESIWQYVGAKQRQCYRYQPETKVVGI